MNLRNRCNAMYQKIQQDAMFRRGSPVDDLMRFVIAERGRASDNEIAETFPLCLYFGSDRDREEVIELIHEVRPNTIPMRMP